MLGILTITSKSVPNLQRTFSIRPLPSGVSMKSPSAPQRSSINSFLVMSISSFNDLYPMLPCQIRFVNKKMCIFGIYLEVWYFCNSYRFFLASSAAIQFNALVFCTFLRSRPLTRFHTSLKTSSPALLLSTTINPARNILLNLPMLD